jgi:2-dehydro-3-deoxyphosphogalactonate aldolase
MDARLGKAMAALPLVAILRGIRPEEAEAIGETLYNASFRIIEVPLNSPRPYESISKLRKRLPADALIGAGTVLDVNAVAAVSAAGGEIAVMPHSDARIIHAVKAHGMCCLPGVSTPTEAFAALAAGADGLKAFPAEMITPAVLKAWRAILPSDIAILPVGGITAQSMAGYFSAGANGFGLGSALYKPGASARDIATRAAAFVDAWEKLRG